MTDPKIAERFRVRPGSRVRLKARDPPAETAFHLYPYPGHQSRSAGGSVFGVHYKGAGSGSAHNVTTLGGIR